MPVPWEALIPFGEDVVFSTLDHLMTGITCEL